MSIKQSVSIEDAIELLNELLILDNNAIGALVANRVPCNELIADHYSVQVEQRNGGFNVGLLGIINGLFGVDEDGWGAITCEFDCGNLIKFRKTSRDDKLARNDHAYNLKELKRAANEACVQAIAKGDLGNNVNWSNLVCTTVRKYIDEDGFYGYEVIIEEADPRNTELQNFIYDVLLRSGFTDIEVITQW